MKNAPWNKRDPLERFSEYFIPEPNSGCWLWTSCIYHSGYGRLFANGASRYAHRLAWEFFRGPIPKTLHVLHKCDNPPCVNPDHLFLGTIADNNADMIAKGRGVQPRGSKQWNSILNEHEVLAIYRDKRANPIVAADYGVHVSTVCDVKRGKNWRWLTQAASPLNGGKL